MLDFKELINYLIDTTCKKAKKPSFKILLLAIMAGAFIAFGSVGNLIVSANLFPINPGIARLIGACVFPVGLIGIVLLGYELFTSNSILIAAVFKKKISIAKMMYLLALIFVGNLIGGSLIALVSYLTHALDADGIKLLSSMAHHKVTTTWYLLIIKGILCNVLVCAAGVMAYRAKDIVSKIFAIFFPIMLFIVLGYDHSVANMLYLPLAYLLKSGISLLDIGYNLFFVTIGNFIGGAMVIVGIIYYAYYHE